jgi:hypothetical protein
VLGSPAMDSAPHLENHAAHIEMHLSSAARATTLEPARSPEHDDELERELDEPSDAGEAA